MEEAAENLQQLCKKAERSGSGLDRLAARAQCERLLALLPESTDVMDINAFLPSEILLMILQFYVVYYTEECNGSVRFTRKVDHRKERWKSMRLVCRLWKDLAGQLPVCTSMTLQERDLDLDAFVRPVVQKFEAFPYLRSITIPLKHMFDGVMFGYILKALKNGENLRELTFASPEKASVNRAYTAGRCRAHLAASVWKTFPSFLLRQHQYVSRVEQKPRIDTLRLEGGHFETIPHTMARSFFRFQNPYLTTLCIPQLGIRQEHLKSDMQSEYYNTVVHPFCREIYERNPMAHFVIWTSTGKKTYKTPLNLRKLPNLKRLEIGSMDLQCTACSLCLPRKLDTLVIHYPDYTNLCIPKDIHAICRFKTLVLKHVPEDTFYDVCTRETFSHQSVEMAEQVSTMLSSIPTGSSGFRHALECRVNEGKTRSYETSPESDAYAVFLLSHPAVQDVRWEHDAKCTYRGSGTLSRTEYRQYGYHCSTFHITMAPYTRVSKRKKEEPGFTMGKKKRKGVK
jgi:hypothetical protein